MNYFLAASLFLGNIDWLEKTSQKPDPEAIEWVKERLKQDIQLEKLKTNPRDIPVSQGEKCLRNDFVNNENDSSTYVFASFSMPDETWIELSKQMEEHQAVFVLRGLPNNSFKQLSKKIQHLTALGVTAPIQIDPQLFVKHKIDKVPTFLIIDEEESHKVSGNISLIYALEKINEVRK